MTCEELLSVIDPYLDGELSAREVVQVHEHLVGCDHCRAALESEATLHSLLVANSAEDDPPPDLRNRVLDGIAATSAAPARFGSRRRHVPGGRALFMGAGLVAVLFVGLIAIQFGRRPDVPPFALEILAKHRLYAEGPSPGVDMMTADIPGLTTWLERRVGFPSRPPGPSGLPSVSSEDERHRWPMPRRRTSSMNGMGGHSRCSSRRLSRALDPKEQNASSTEWRSMRRGSQA